MRHLVPTLFLFRYIRQVIPQQVFFPYGKIYSMKVDGKKLLKITDFYLKKMGLKSKGSRSILLKHMKKIKKKHQKEWEHIINEKSIVHQFKKP